MINPLSFATGCGAAGVLLVLAAGCSTVGDYLKIDTPTARVANVGLDGISLDAATLQFDVEVANPYPAPLALGNLDYRLASRDAVFLSGEANLQGSVPAGGRKRVTLPARIVYADLFRALKGIRPGSVVPYRADLGIGMESQFAGALRIPLRKEGELPVPAPPKVEVSELKWDRLNLTEAAGHARLRLQNANEFPVELSKFTYVLSLGDVEVARTAVTDVVGFGPSGGVGELEIPISVSPAKLGLAAFRMLQGSGASYALQGVMAANTPFGEMSLPINQSGRTPIRK
jgi:LEA14-like dessication related protein